jgi:hypothetical protein
VSNSSTRTSCRVDIVYIPALEHYEIVESHFDTHSSGHSDDEDEEGRGGSSSDSSEERPVDESAVELDAEPSPPSPNEDDVFAVRHHLTHFIPLELVDTTLDVAMYWPRITTECTDHLSVPARYLSARNTALYCVVTPPRQGAQGELRACEPRIRLGGRKQTSAVRSCASSEKPGLSHSVGTYIGSWTRFEAAIVRDNGQSIQEYLLGLGMMNITEQQTLSRVRAAEVGGPAARRAGL